MAVQLQFGCSVLEGDLDQKDSRYFNSTQMNLGKPEFLITPPWHFPCSFFVSNHHLQGARKILVFWLIFFGCLEAPPPYKSFPTPLNGRSFCAQPLPHQEKSGAKCLGWDSQLGSRTKVPKKPLQLPSRYPQGSDDLCVEGHFGTTQRQLTTQVQQTNDLGSYMWCPWTQTVCILKEIGCICCTVYRERRGGRTGWILVKRWCTHTQTLDKVHLVWLSFLSLMGEFLYGQLIFIYFHGIRLGRDDLWRF